jgi:cellobiose dehydrogenase (acceptor)
MTNSLLLVAWPYNGTILTSFRFATGYNMPGLYTGDATLTQISSSINSSHYTLVFRCQNCLKWSQNGQAGAASTSQGSLVLGWAQALPAPGNPSCPEQITLKQHDNGQNIFAGTLSNNSVSSNYSSWSAMATKTVPGSCANATATGVSSVPVPTGATFDYIVVGGGAGGIPIADKLSEAGKSVLLIEKGPPSSGRWGGTLKPQWLVGTNLTRFDVPGLCNEIWVDSAGIACTDTDQMAGCKGQSRRRYRLWMC